MIEVVKSGALFTLCLIVVASVNGGVKQYVANRAAAHELQLDELCSKQYAQFQRPLVCTTRVKRSDIALPLAG